MIENTYRQEIDRRSDREVHLEADLRTCMEIAEIIMTLDALGSQINTLWSTALANQDFDEVTRLVEASHAIHRAASALEIDDSLIP